MEDKLALVRGIQVTGRAEITTARVEIVADKNVVEAVGVSGKKSLDERLKALAHRFVETHQLLGLDVKGLTRIIISGQRPTDSQAFST